jgi:Aspartate/tyrosine/aromatic aminotransferase
MKGRLSVHRERMRGNSVRQIMAEAQGRYPDVIELQIGESDRGTPAHIVEAAKQALDRGFTHYTENAGLLSLREAVAGRMKRKYGVPVDPGRVVVSTGAVAALHVALLSLVDVGEEVLIPDPGYPNYEGLVRLMNGQPVYYPARKERGFVPDIDEMEALVTPFTKAVVVNSPNNPTGAVYPRKTWEQMLDMADRYNLYIISDEIYDEMVYEGSPVCPLAVRPDLAHRIVSVNGFSKGYAMTGWRLGYMVAPEHLVPLICKLQEPTTTCAAAFTQLAGEAALNGDQGHLAEMRERYARQRNMTCSLLERYGIVHHRPQGAMYVMADISPTGLTATVFARELLHSKQVMVAPGDGFGPSGHPYVRICFAGQADRLEEGLNRLGKFYAGLATASARQSTNAGH